MTTINVMTKKFTRFGKVYPASETEYTANIEKNSITIFKNGVEGRTFRIGDEAEYDSYNLIYTGTITKITEKCVTIVAYKGHSGMERTHRLDLNSFCWRNYNFDPIKTAEQNHYTMMYI